MGLHVKEQTRSIHCGSDLDLRGADRFPVERFRRADWSDLQPPLNEVVDIKFAGGSLEILYNAFTGYRTDGLYASTWEEVDFIVDIRDVAEMHVAALTTEDAGGCRRSSFRCVRARLWLAGSL